MNAGYRLKRYFLDMNFYPGEIEFGPDLVRRRLAWASTMYALLALGLFSQQAIDLTQTPITVRLDALRWRTLACSAVAAFALLPIFTSWFNTKFPKPAVEHVIWAFTFGFFVNLSANGVTKMIAKVFFHP